MSALHTEHDTVRRSSLIGAQHDRVYRPNPFDANEAQHCRHLDGMPLPKRPRQRRHSRNILALVVLAVIGITVGASVAAVFGHSGARSTAALKFGQHEVSQAKTTATTLLTPLSLGVATATVGFITTSTASSLAVSTRTELFTMIDTDILTPYQGSTRTIMTTSILVEASAPTRPNPSTLTVEASHSVTTQSTTVASTTTDLSTVEPDPPIVQTQEVTIIQVLESTQRTTHTDQTVTRTLSPKPVTETDSQTAIVLASADFAVSTRTSIILSTSYTRTLSLRHEIQQSKSATVAKTLPDDMAAKLHVDATQAFSLDQRSESWITQTTTLRTTHVVKHTKHATQTLTITALPTRTRTSTSFIATSTQYLGDADSDCPQDRHKLRISADHCALVPVNDVDFSTSDAECVSFCEQVLSNACDFCWRGRRVDWDTDWANLWLKGISEQQRRCCERCDCANCEMDAGPGKNPVRNITLVQNKGCS